MTISAGPVASCVWVSPPEWVDRRTKEIADQLQRSRVAGGETVHDGHGEPEGPAVPARRGHRAPRSPRDGESINRDLQVRRLERIRNVGMLAVFLLIGFAPILVSGSIQALWDRTDPVRRCR